MPTMPAIDPRSPSLRDSVWLIWLHTSSTTVGTMSQVTAARIQSMPLRNSLLTSVKRRASWASFTA